MPEPLGGLVAIAEFGSRFEADAAAVILRAEGVDATVLGDPVTQVGRYLSSELYFTVAVNEEEVELGRATLRRHGTDEDALDPPPEPLPWKPALGVVGALVVFLGLLGFAPAFGVRAAVAFVVLIVVGAGAVSMITHPGTAEGGTGRSVWHGRPWIVVAATVLLGSVALTLAATAVVILR